MVRPDDLMRLSIDPAKEPFWFRNATHRFDDPLMRFGVTYCADGLETAFCETVLHEAREDFSGTWTVAEEDIHKRHVLRYLPHPEPFLRLVDLTGTALKRLGLNNDISAGSDYTLPQLWSRAIHEAAAHWDGIRYCSRQLNSNYCYALFERSGLTPDPVASPLTRPQLASLVQQFNVVLL
jgi:hypothetical protein